MSDLLNETQYAIAPLIWIAAAAFAAAIIFFTIIVNSEPNSKTKHIAILGLRSAGKTFLWNRLRSYTGHLLGFTTTADIDEFILEGKTKKVKIAKTMDYGGGAQFVKHYDDLIREDMHIYFMFNINHLDNENTKDIRARFIKILTVIKANEYKNVTISFLATHYDIYQKMNNECYQETHSKVYERINLSDISNQAKEDYKIKLKLGDRYKLLRLVNLQDDTEITRIKNEILGE